ncbi:LPD38 domain-containing protein [Halomonas salifodinae]|uniref:LPD38 domain-containing protein n=1 Tax=Halomonas salifodinae TaxID=438745 RepID=A0ABW2F487_9GAMM
MALLDDLRQENPALASYSDDQLKSALRQEPQFKYLDDEEFEAHVSGRPVAETQDSAPGFRAGLSSGVDQLQAMGGGLVMAAGEALESEGMLRAGRDIYQRNMEEADENALGFGFTDIRSPGDAWQWASYTAGNQLPMLAASVASGGVGGAAAGVGARMLAGAAAKQAATRIGQAAGAAAGSVGMETGALMGETGDLDAALAHGALAGSLDAITPVRLLRAAGRGDLADRAATEISEGALGDLRRQASRTARGAAGRGSLTNLLTEASTEGLQGLINQHANYWVENNGETLLANLGEVDIKALIDEAAAGGLMGGIVGAPTGLAERSQARTQAQRIEQAREQAAAMGGDSLDQAQAAQQAEQATPDAPPAPDPAMSAALGNRIQLAMGELDDLQRLARGSSYQGQTRLRNISRMIDRAEQAFEEGNSAQAGRMVDRAERIAANLRNDLARVGSDERPVRAEGELVDDQPTAGLIGTDSRRLPHGDPSTIYAEGPTVDQTQYDPQARSVRRDEGMQAGRRMRDAAVSSQPLIEDSGTIYGQGPVAGNANTGLDRPSADPRFTARQEPEVVHSMPDGSTMAGPEHEGAVPGSTREASPAAPEVRAEEIAETRQEPLQYRSDGRPFADERVAMASGVARSAQRQGSDVRAVEVPGGFALSIRSAAEALSAPREMMAETANETAVEALRELFRDRGRDNPGVTFDATLENSSPRVREAALSDPSVREAFEAGQQEAAEAEEPADPTAERGEPVAPREEPAEAQEGDAQDVARDEAQVATEERTERESGAAEAPARDDEDGSEFSLGEREDAEGPLPTVEEVEAALEGMPELGDVEVVSTTSRLPTEVLANMRRLGVSPVDVKGVHHGGKTYVVAVAHDNVSDAVRTAVHEAVGHKGMRGVLGKDLDRVMLDLYRSLPGSPEGRQALTEVREAYPFLDPSKRKDRITIGEEMVAHLLEKGRRPKAWQRAMAKIRDLLRRLFPSVAWTYTDVLALGEQSREWLRRQKAQRQEGGVDRYSMRDGIEPDETIDPNGIVELHGVEDQSRFEALRDRFRETGEFAGPPIVVYRDEYGAPAALNGSHRIAAVREVGIDVPVVYVEDAAASYESEGGMELADLSGRGDERVAAFLREAGDDRAARLMEREARLNAESFVLYSLRGKQRAAFEQAFDDFTDADRAAAAKIGSRTPPQRAMDWFKEQADRAGLKIRQGMVDRVAALKELDEQLYGESALGENINRSSWVLARMSNAANGALHAMLHNGRIRLDAKEKIITLQDGDAKGLGEVLGRLGSAAEIERFMGWIAGQRAAQLAKDGRENLFDAGDIEAMKGWNRGQMEDGRSREETYQEVFEEFQQYRDDVLAVAEQSGIISKDQREMWAEEFYVPFYRIAEDDKQAPGMMATSGLSRQQAYKRLKGGSQNLNDLLQNTMMNFHHLLDASLKNQAAVQAVENAKQLGMVEKVPESNRDTKKSTFVMEGGKKVFYEIDDPLVFQALTALAHPGMNSTLMRVLRKFKRVFTNSVTITPQFIAANLIRDSIQATATNDISKNVLANVLEGGATLKDAKLRAQMMASGASFNFGHLYGSNPDELRAQMTRGMRNAKLVALPGSAWGVAAKPIDMIRAGWNWWGDVNNAAENLNRAAIYAQNREQGELRAAFEARDLIDFSAHGAWPAVRVLIDIVPFLNARIQGLDKIYRSGVRPGAAVLREVFGNGKASLSDKQLAGRFWAVTGAVTMATLALYLHNYDNEEYKELEEWERDTYWHFFAGDSHFVLPKPFEVGAIGTLAERITQQFVDDQATGKLFAERLAHMMSDTFSFTIVPQALQPALDVYANKDSFTNRPIEGMGMQRLSPELRRRYGTSKVATLASMALNSTVGAIGNPETNPLALSPVQVDHLIEGYFGAVGGWTTAATDVAVRTISGEDAPEKRWYEYQPVRRFYRNLGDVDPYTRYASVFYDGLSEARRAHADVQELREMGELAEAAELAETNRDLLRLRLPLNRAQRRLRTINQRIDIIRRSSLDGEIKRQRIDRLQAVKVQIQRALGERILDARFE